jgi:hypothetical protein
VESVDPSSLSAAPIKLSDVIQHST